MERSKRLIRSAFSVMKSIRRRYYRFLACPFGRIRDSEGCVYSPGCKILSPRHITIGRRTFIGRDVLISTSKSGGSPVTIGADVMIAQRAQIIGGNHEFRRLDVPMNQQGEGKQGAIVIEDDVWIGAGVIVLSGVRIGTGAIAAAGSVINKDVEPYLMVAGNPMRPIGKRQ